MARKKTTVEKMLEYMDSQNAFVHIDLLVEFCGLNRAAVIFYLQHEMDMERVWQSQVKGSKPYYRITQQGQKWLATKGKRKRQK